MFFENFQVVFVSVTDLILPFFSFLVEMLNVETNKLGMKPNKNTS
jgi:hypothetical protein